MVQLRIARCSPQTGWGLLITTQSAWPHANLPCAQHLQRTTLQPHSMSALQPEPTLGATQAAMLLQHDV